MSVVLVEGFDLYNGIVTNTGLQAKWTASTQITGGAAPTLTMTTGRFAEQCVRATYSGSNNAAGFTARGLPSSYASLAIGVAYRCTLLSNVATSNLPIIIQWREGGTYHLHLTVSTDGKVNVYRASSVSAGTLLGSSAAGVIITNTWQYIEVETVINDTTGRVTVYVDGAQVLNLTGQDTRNAGTGVIDTINLCGNCAGTSGTSHDFDDLYVVDAATVLGPRRVETRRPTADSGTVQFTPSTGVTHWPNVDDATVNGDTDYNSGSTVGDVDRYTHGGLSSTPGAIDAVQVSIFAEKTDATSRAITAQVKSSSTTSDGSTFTLATSYGKFERLILTDPNTSAAWGASAVNALEFGPKVTI